MPPAPIPVAGDWETWKVWEWCPLTGALPDWTSIDDQSRIVAMIYQIREDFFSVYGGTGADCGEDANFEAEARSAIEREARLVWWRGDQITRRALGGVDGPRRFPGLADAWRERPENDMLDALCTDAAAILSNFGEREEQEQIAKRWPVHRVLAVLTIGELATVLRDILIGQVSQIEAGANGRRHGAELLHAVALMQMAYSLRAGRDQRAGEAMRARARARTDNRVHAVEDAQADVLNVAHTLIVDSSFASLKACALAVYAVISGSADVDESKVAKVAKTLAADATIVGSCKSRRGRPRGKATTQ